jgi:hypothetical protein
MQLKSHFVPVDLRWGIVTCIILALLTFEVKAQLDESLKVIKEDGYIEKMSQYVGLKLSMSNHIETFLLQTDANKIELYPNTSTTGKISFNYRFISFSIGYTPRFIPGNGDNVTLGKTKSSGYGFGLSFRHWFHDLSYTRTRGYYLNNTRDYNTAWVSGNPYIQFPDLVYKKFQGITGYSFNPKFSVNSLTSQTERQLKSAGSFIPLAVYRYYIIDDRTPLAAANTSQRTNNFEFAISAGYHYTVVLKQNFYFSLEFAPGFGYNFAKLYTRSQTESVITRSKSPEFRWDGRGAIGYNGDRFFAGAILNLGGTSFRQEHTTAINNGYTAFYQLFLGYRLNTPKILSESVDKALRMIK